MVLIDTLSKNISIQIVMTTNTGDFVKFLMIKQNLLLKIFKLLEENNIKIVSPENYINVSNVIN